MRGGAGDDVYLVDQLDDRVIEVAGEGTDVIITAMTWRLSGNVENLYLTGTGEISGYGDAGANVLAGAAGRNLLDGGLGADTLTGGGARDAFQFSTALGAGNVDTITDFVSRTDVIRLSVAAFGGLAKGPLSADALWLGTSAHDANDRIIFDAAAGALYYDADGNGAGAAVLFAQLQGVSTLVAADFLVY
jgi:Ca2+-binding RTX toxin-like protein